MTSRQIQQARALRPEDRFPDFPPGTICRTPVLLDGPGHQAALRRHFGGGVTLIVLSEVPVRWTPGQRGGHRIPDLLMAFDVDRALAIAQNGYSIRDQGKPPDLVLEIASESTGEADCTAKQRDHAAFGIPEYWRFDPSRSRHHDGAYQPIEIIQTGEGRSDVLGLSICWVDGNCAGGTRQSSAAWRPTTKRLKPVLPRKPEPKPSGKAGSPSRRPQAGQISRVRAWDALVVLQDRKLAKTGHSGR